MIDESESVVVMEASPDELDRVVKRLASVGIDSAIVLPDSGKGGSWGTKLWLAVASHDAPRTIELFRNDWLDGLDPEQRAAVDAANRIVIDPEAPETTCPACLTTFKTGPNECPDCGLCVG